VLEWAQEGKGSDAKGYRAGAKGASIEEELNKSGSQEGF
jgi:hypothetical protein